MKNLYRLRQIQLIRGLGITVAAVIIVGCASLPVTYRTNGHVQTDGQQRRQRRRQRVCTAAV